MQAMGAFGLVPPMPIGSLTAPKLRKKGCPRIKEQYNALLFFIMIMQVCLRRDILQLLLVTACCLSILWLVHSPKRLAEVLYARNNNLINTGNSFAKAGREMGKAEALQEINAAITANKVMVYSKTHCPYCVKAKNALNKFIEPDQYTVVELDQRADTNVMQDALLEMTGARSVPRVFINGKFLGGGDDTAAAAANGTLQKLLTEAGVLEEAGRKEETQEETK